MALTLLFVFPMLYLVPLPAELAGSFPGREPYAAGRALLMDGDGSGLTRLSLFPFETESAWLLLLVPIAVFVATRTLDSPRVLRLILLLLAVAALQALIGLLQYGASPGSPQLLGMQLPDVQSAQGTYTNRNHLAGLLEMVLPIALALMIYSVGRGGYTDRRGWKGRLTFLASTRGHAALVYGAIALLLLVGVVFTRSRAGIVLSMMAVLLSTLVFARRIGGNNVYGATGTLVAIAVGIGIAIGLLPVLDRFSAAGAIQDARWTIFGRTLDGIGAFAPIGSGPGNYPDVFPAFQPLELGRWFINHAHNDFLEWLFEGGLLAAGLILLLLFLYTRQWTRLWKGDEWSRFRFVQVAAGIGLLLLLLHSLVDYNLHMPANIAYFAFLAGVFFSDPMADPAPARRRRRRTPNLEDSSHTIEANPDDQPAESARIQSDNGEATLDFDNKAGRSEAMGMDAAQIDQDTADALHQIRELAAKLARRTPRLLLVQTDEASDGEIDAAKLGNLEHRLAAYNQLIDQHLGALLEELGKPSAATRDSLADKEPRSEDGLEDDSLDGSDDLRVLQADLTTVITAVDAFVEQPTRGDSLSELDEKVREAEYRLHLIAGKRTSTSPLQQEPPLRPQTRVRDLSSGAQWRTGTGEGESKERPPAKLPDATPWEPPAEAGFDATRDLEFAKLRERVQRLETRLRISAYVLMIAGGLAAAAWLWSKQFVSNSMQERTIGDREMPAHTLAVGNPADRLSWVQQLDTRVETLQAEVSALARKIAEEPTPTPEATTQARTMDAEPEEVAQAASVGANDRNQTEHSPSVEVPTDQEQVAVAETETARDPNSKSTTESDEVMTLDAPRFGIQLIAFEYEENMTDFVEKAGLGDDAAYTRSSARDDGLYIVVQGLYLTRGEAQKAMQALSPELKRLEPWVTSYPGGTVFYRIDSR